MNLTTRTQMSALALATLMTLTLMAGIQQLADVPATGAAMASAASTPVQVVVVTGKRASQS